MMKLLTKAMRRTMPALYSQQAVEDPMVPFKFFDPVGSWTWYVIEGRPTPNPDECPGWPEEDYLFFGLVDGQEAELGYFTLNQLLTCKEGATGLRALPIERDLLWTPKPLSAVRDGLRQTG